MEEARYEVKKDDGNFMAKEITKDSDVIEAPKREEDQRVHAHNSWMEEIFMLIYLLFVVVTQRMNCLCAYERELVDDLFAGQRKE